MLITSVMEEAFIPYGKVVGDIRLSGLVNKMAELWANAGPAISYTPSANELEELPVYREIRDRVYGGWDVQIGCVSGENHSLTALEYHRCSEVIIAAEDIYILVGRLIDVCQGGYDLAQSRLFFLPAGVGVELYATTLHYTPLSTKKGQIFRAAIALPRGTNGPKPTLTHPVGEDLLLNACNNWLIACPGSPEAQRGAFPGLSGVNSQLQQIAIKEG